MDRFELIKSLDIRRVVIKIGSSLLEDKNSPDGLNAKTLSMLVSQIKGLQESGKQVLLVSSGAVNTGRNLIAKHFNRKIQSNPEVARKQALAAIGQAPLVSRFASLFAENEVPVAQILITARDFQNRRSYLNIGHTIDELMQMGVLPIINENDTVSTQELQFGENDLLSAACAALFKADLLIILTSVDGFLLNDKRLSQITEISNEHRAAAGGPAGPGSGGMVTKLRAGELCQSSGIALAILPGFHEAPISDLFDGSDIGTVMYAPQDSIPIGARKKWLLFSQTQGGICIDKGAIDALLHKGSSLLMAGVLSIRGDFYAGEVVDIFEEVRVIGRGVCSYGSRELQAFVNVRGDSKKEHLEYGGVVIHRNDLVLEVSP